MISKTEKCLYCGEKMESKTAKKKFCSTIHRVYFNRELALAKLSQKGLPKTNIDVTEMLFPKNTSTITGEEKMPEGLHWKDQLEWNRNHKK